MENEPKESMDISDEDTEPEYPNDSESKSDQDIEPEYPNDSESKSDEDIEPEYPKDDKSESDKDTDNKAIISDKKTLLLVSGFGLVLVALAFVLGWMLGSGGVGCSRDRDSFRDFAVATVNGIDINASDVSFLILYAEQVLMSEYREMFPDSWEIDYDNEFREGVSFGRAIREEAVRIAAMTIIQLQYAEQLDITLSDDEIQQIDLHIQSLIDHFGEAEFNDMLLSDGVKGPAHLARILETDILIEKLYFAIIEDPNEFARFEQYMAEEDRDEELLAAKHILLRFADFDSEEEAEELAETLWERALAGEDFDALIAEYGQDPGMVSNPEGYTFVEGVMVPEFEQATRELEIGEISEPVRTSHGLHIIMRIEPDEDNILRPRGSDVMTLEDRMFEAIFTGFEAMTEQADIVFLRRLDEIEVGQR